MTGPDVPMTCTRSPTSLWSAARPCARPGRLPDLRHAERGQVERRRLPHLVLRATLGQRVADRRRPWRWTPSDGSSSCEHAGQWPVQLTVQHPPRGTAPVSGSTCGTMWIAVSLGNGSIRDRKVATGTGLVDGRGRPINGVSHPEMVQRILPFCAQRVPRRTTRCSWIAAAALTADAKFAGGWYRMTTGRCSGCAVRPDLCRLGFSQGSIGTRCGASLGSRRWRLRRRFLEGFSWTAGIRTTCSPCWTPGGPVMWGAPWVHLRGAGARRYSGEGTGHAGGEGSLFPTGGRSLASATCRTPS